ncbi:serine/threonine protein kinase [Nostoc sp. RF31YmG]|nr:serine/threonine protein kinase [Nostoc sp. RF31YmG]
MVSTQVSIPGYSINEELYNGSRTLVYRGYRETDQQPVAIKLLKNPYPSFSELVQFRNQYTIANNLNSPLIIQTYSLETYQNGYALVMEDFGGVSLNKWLAKTGNGRMGETPQALMKFLRIAIALCNTLDILYRHHIIHKDIKPANILINPQTHEIRLIDFSIASLLPRETQTLMSPNVLEGTLAYLSPEQTGRMNRGIDYRSDFYSLGVTFYELLTGELPFQSNDPMELLHCHIAKMPTALGNREEIPEVLSEIVMKLMAKNAEDRYQSALGLKYDLENCLEQIQTKGKIENFPIARRDVCDRFLIPDKLYGRETEVEKLLSAFERVSTGKNEMVLVAGFSGVGKTAVVNEVHKPIVQKRGYFIKGKFDQFQRNIPFSAFVQALRDLMVQLLSENDRQLQQWKTQILSALGENAQVIVEVIPELEQIIGSQPSVPELGNNAAHNRFNLLFQRFIATFTTHEHPLVIFLDDLQWADSASLKLLELLMSATERGYLLVIGAYRDNEVFPAHPLMFTLNEIGKTGTIFNTITLASLKISQINQLIADTLSCSPELALSLTKLVYQKTQGNPFFNNQFLKALYEEGLITFNVEMGYWQCDLAKINALALTDDVVEFMAMQLQKLPIVTQNLLQLAACIGNSFDLNTLATVHQKSPDETAANLWKALELGLILPTSEVYKFFQETKNKPQSNLSKNPKFPDPTFRFLHDRVQQAAYSLIPEAQKQFTHLKIGQLLLQNTPKSQQEERIFEIVSQLNCGIAIITQASDRQQLVQLNLNAGRKAKEATAYGAAIYYLNHGIQLLTTNSWEIAYDLTRSLYEEAAEASFLNKEFEQMESLIQVVLEQTTSLLDRVKVYEVKLQAYQVQGEPFQAIATGRDILQQLGVTIPEIPTPSDIQQSIENTLLLLANRNIESLAQLPLMKDTKALVALRIMASIAPSIHQAAPYLLPILACEEVNLSLKYGNAPLSAPGYADFGIVLHTLNKLEEGYEFGQLALKIVDILQAKSVQSMTAFKVAAFNQCNKQHISSSINLFQEAYTSGLETGDFFHVLASMIFKFFYTYLSGAKPLETLLEDIKSYESNFAKNQRLLNWSNLICQNISNLTTSRENPESLIGEYSHEEQLLPVLLNQNDELTLHIFFLNKLMLAYLFDHMPEAIKNADQVEQYLKGGVGMLSVPVFYYYDSLCRLAVYQMAEPLSQAQLLLQVNENQEKLKYRAKCAPMNFQHKYDLVEAEKHRVLGQKTEAMEYYDRAINLAKEHEYIQEVALANELAAKFYLEWGKPKVAQAYMQEAYYCYARWGAKAKTNDLEKRYPELLAPILQAQQHRFHLSDTYISTVDSSSFLHQTIQTSNSSSGSISKSLDFSTILKALQALSSEIHLEQLLNTLMEVLMANAGAKKVALLVLKDENWVVETISTINEGTSQLSVSSDTSQIVPMTLINYVKRSGKTLVLDDATSQTNFIADPYMMQQQPKSVMCTPIWHQGKLIGLLYLENKLTIGAFTRDRTEVIQLLCAQAAISLENARLYQQSQDYAQQLEQMLQELKVAQLQMVQNEKMATLGNLVAGVAHEINNPVGFLKGSLNNTEEYIQDLLAHVQLFQQHHPHLAAPVIEHGEEIDLEFISEDLPKLVTSMKVASERIKEISNSLRTFSRADTTEKVACNLHEGIESTLLILKYRLKASEKRPAIEVIKDYGKLPLVKCFLGQLNQVFMNILANAIDVLDTSTEGRSFGELQANSQRITISTAVSTDGRTVAIRIQDNGPGMLEAIQAKVFDHLFTTKEVGQGTGLGLAIARQIVEETHNGKLSCNSVVGEGTEFLIEIPV